MTIPRKEDAASSMVEPFEADGLWWTTEDPENQVSGRLRYDPKHGNELTVLATLPVEGDDPHLGLVGTVQGHTSTLGPITLFRCVGTSIRIGSGRLPQQRISSPVIVIGKHAGSLKTYWPRKGRLHITNLEEWFWIRAFLQEPLRIEEGTTNLKVALPDKLEFAIPSRHAQLQSVARYQSFGGAIREASVRVTLWLEVEFEEPQQIKRFAEFASGIRDLVSLSLGNNASILNLEFLREPDEEEYDTNLGPVKCFYAQNPKCSEFDPNKTWFEGFRIDDLNSAKNDIFERWFTFCDDTSPTIKTLLSILDTEMYLDVRFLLATQALESLHRRLWDSKFVDQSAYEDIRTTLVNAIPEGTPNDLRSKLMATLKYGNEVSLRRRLREIGKYLDEKGEPRFISFSPYFIDRVVAVRNYLTHYDADLKEKGEPGDDLFELFAKLVIGSFAIVYSELGVPWTTIHDRIKGHRLVGRYVQS